ncbi:hypothetical protein TIFTF001_040288 [Ficus carica]|uniref:Uncharacterized protein n=1 Tax=Ficus carica TaxID=3494 RepID=A0AA87YTF8_FICCA|nr:hypothetical protein TIFTF001_040288 [Ficus carica]
MRLLISFANPRIEKLREKPDLERNQNRLLANESLPKYNWFISSSTSGYPHDQPRSVQSEKEVPQEVPTASTSVMQSGDSSPGTWGPRIADENVEEVIRQLYLARGLRIKVTSGSVRPIDQERATQLQRKFSKGGDGSRTHSGSQGSGSVSRASSDPHIAWVVSFTFFGNAAARNHINRMDEKVAGLVSEVKKWREAEKMALKKANKAKEQALKVEEARKKVEVELSSIQYENSRYLQEAFLAALNQAHFTLANPSLTRLNWSFMPEISGETQGDGYGTVVNDGEEGEVVGGAQLADDVVVIGESETTTDPSVTELVGPPE